MTGRARPVSPAAAGTDPEDDARFLATYDLERYPRPSVAVDVALLTVTEGALHAALLRRTRPPETGRWALPGGFIRPGESPEDAVSRLLRAKTGLTDVYTGQLATFGDPGRDPRGWIVSIAYYALVPVDRLIPVLETAAEMTLARLRLADDDPWGPLTASGPGGEMELAFDHAAILSRAADRVRGRLWYAPVAFELMPDEFTLLDLQRAYEAILGRTLDKNSFRRRILAQELVTPVGRRREGLRARPAELYRFVRRSDER